MCAWGAGDGRQILGDMGRRARRSGELAASGFGWVWVGITARKRHTFRVNKSPESRIYCLSVSSQVWWWVLNDRARARDHARFRACVHGWVVCLRLVEFEIRRQAALVATGRAPPCVVLQLQHSKYLSGPPCIDFSIAGCQLGTAGDTGRPELL